MDTQPAEIPKLPQEELTEQQKAEALTRQHPQRRQDDVTREAIMAQPISATDACPFCGSTQQHRHASDPTHIVITHADGCHMGRITIIPEGSDRHQSWNSRPAPAGTVVTK